MNRLVDPEISELKTTMVDIVKDGKAGAIAALGKNRNKSNKEDLAAVLKAASTYSRLYASETNRLQTAIITAKITNDQAIADDVFEAISGRRPDNAALAAPDNGERSSDNGSVEQ